jgi:integrase
VHVRRQVKIVRSRLVFDLPKGRRQRDVPLPDSVSLRLSAHLAAFPARHVTLPWAMPAGKAETAELMFTLPSGGALDRNDFNRYAWHQALASAGLPRGRENGFHALRHHFASVLLAGGIDIRTLAEYLGHSDPGFTLRTYTHLLPSAPDRMRKVIDQAAAHEADGPNTAQQAGDQP